MKNLRSLKNVWQEQLPVIADAVFSKSAKDTSQSRITWPIIIFCLMVLLVGLLFFVAR